MTREEAVNWIINISADIGKADHKDLWHYEQAFYEIRDMLESSQPEPCEDAVSRKKVFEYFVPLWECIGTIMDRNEWEDVCKTTANELPSVTPKVEQRWIPCDVRMPEEHDSIFAKFKGTGRWNKIMWEKQSEKALVTVEYDDGTRDVEVASTFDGKWKYRTAVVDRYPVAWCHFPEPYREEGGE